MIDPTPDVSGDRHNTTSSATKQTAKQLDLLDHGKHAASTRAIAAASAISKGPSRRDLIQRHVADCGVHGATRFEIHEALAIPYTSIPGPVLALLASGRVYETERTRCTPYGKPAAVLVSCPVRGRDE